MAEDLKIEYYEGAQKELLASMASKLSCEIISIIKSFVSENQEAKSDNVDINLLINTISTSLGICSATFLLASESNEIDMFMESIKESAIHMINDFKKSQLQ